MSNIAISFEHVSKMYQLGVVGTGTISNDLKRWWHMNVLRKDDPFLKVGQTNDRASKAKNEFVYALRDIDFKVEQGDVVGIIGKNGAGKSTLLKLLSRITAPTTGCIKAKGRIASLLEVGTGFHQELTGRENIYLNGSIMGMTKREIDAKLDEIVDFSGCEMYIDTPVKRFSSGMQVRLGFAVAAFLEPEILVVDEVLAVGDAEFQKKAIGKMQDVASNGGRTVLFVSHNMPSVRKLCRNGVVLNNGMVSCIGTVSECIDFYSDTNIRDLTDYKEVRPYEHAGGHAREIEFVSVRLLNDPYEIATDEPLYLELTLKKNTKNVDKSQFAVLFSDESDTRVLCSVSSITSLQEQPDIFKVRMRIDNHGLTKGRYQLTFFVGIIGFSCSQYFYDAVINALSLEVQYVKKANKDPYVAWTKRFGAILLDSQFISTTFKK